MKTDLYSIEGHSLSAELDRIREGRYPSCAVVCDATLPTMPIVFATPEFCRVTGYRRDEVIGRNCRFLQGPQTDPRHVEAIRTAIYERQQITVPILNYTKRGEATVNSLHLSPCFDDGGAMVRYLAYQTFCALERGDREAPSRFVLPRSGCRVSLDRYIKGGVMHPVPGGAVRETPFDTLR